ncbi:conserved hypothetical protein [Ricinus communis]|uniref:Uncharacterized protein n=1 Tax=Ricinus communis TaxID=3988 RepID=B9RV36_RICCO|nr:conserved hypothetical protein [Ricinus communis]
MNRNNGQFPPHFQKSSPFAAKEDALHCHDMYHDRALRSPATVENITHKPPPQKQLESKPSVDINESAEAFIKKFRKQLLIQRLESIENYEKMLARESKHG